MEYMHELKDMLCEELERIADKGELTAGSLETIDKLTHSIKSIATIIAMDEAGYSYDDVSMGDRYRRSYATRRDRMGRYSRRYDRYSRDGEHEKMVRKLEEVMHETTDQNAKDAIKQAIDAIGM